MSLSINKVFLCGRLGQDPNIRTLGDGTKVCDFSLATGGEKWTNKDGKEIETPTQWHNCVLWKGLAEIAEKFLKKGHSVTIVGELSYRSYEDKEGQKRYATDIIANDIFLGGAPMGSDGKKAADPSQYAQPSGYQGGAPEAAPAAPIAAQAEDNDKLPF